MRSQICIGFYVFQCRRKDFAAASHQAEEQQRRLVNNKLFICFVFFSLSAQTSYRFRLSVSFRKKIFFVTGSLDLGIWPWRSEFTSVLRRFSGWSKTWRAFVHWSLFVFVFLRKECMLHTLFFLLSLNNWWRQIQETLSSRETLLFSADFHF